MLKTSVAPQSPTPLPGYLHFALLGKDDCSAAPNSFKLSALKARSLEQSRDGWGLQLLSGVAVTTVGNTSISMGAVMSTRTISSSRTKTIANAEAEAAALTAAEAEVAAGCRQ